MDDDEDAPPAVRIVVDDEAVFPSYRATDWSRGAAGLLGGGGTSCCGLPSSPPMLPFSLVQQKNAFGISHEYDMWDK
jgi:hypothetical protein